MSQNLLAEVKERVSQGDLRLSDAIARILPTLRGKASDDDLIWCSNELQGYPNGLDYYHRKFTDLPPYRVVNGLIKVIQRDGSSTAISHPMASRSDYFLSAPVGWLEDFYTLPGELSVVELPELTSYIGKETGGTIVCQCTKTQLLRIIGSIKQSLLALLDKELAPKAVREAPKPKAVAPVSFVPEVEVHSSETPFTKIRIKANDLMKEAHSNKGWIIPTDAMTLSPDQAERHLIHAAVDLILKMGWGTPGTDNVFLLTEQGARELEQSTRQFDTF